MKNKIKIVTLVFDQLLHLARKSFEREAAENGMKLPKGRKGADYYGFPKSKSTKNEEKDSGDKPGPASPNLTASLLRPQNRPAVKKHVVEENLSNLGTKHIYNLTREFSKKGPYDTVPVEERVANLLAIYIGYESFANFVEKGPGILPQPKEVQLKVLKLKDDKLLADQLSDLYLGFYYSFSSAKRKTVRLKVNFFNGSNIGYPCVLTGVHDDDRDDFDITYSGHLIDKPTCSYVEMSNEENDRPFTMIGFRGHLPTQDHQIIRFAAMGVSQQGHPFSFEILFVRVDEDNRSLTNKQIIPFFEQMRYIDFYLQAQRRNFRVPARNIRSMGEIKARGNKANRVKGLVGIYRVFTVGAKYGLIQHIYEMKEDFTSWLYVDTANEEHQEQPCMISISNNQEKLCIAAHRKNGVAVVNYAIFDISPEEDEITKPRLREGVFCGIGNEDNSYGAGKIAVWRDNEPGKPGPVSGAELKKLASGSETLRTGLLATILSKDYLVANKVKGEKVDKLLKLLESIG